MVEMSPSFMQNVCRTPQLDRLVISNLACIEGVSDVAGGDLLITSTGAADGSVQVAEGGAFIEGKSIADQGMYSVYNDSPRPLGPFADNATGNPRIDIVAAVIEDGQYGQGSNSWFLAIIPGTATAGANLTYGSANYHLGVETNPANLPTSYIVLGYVLVPNGFTSASTVSAGDIEDARSSFGHCSGEPYVTLTASGATSLANNTYTQVTLATQTWIAKGYFSVTGSTITVLKAGLYDINVQASFDQGGVGTTGTQRLMVVIKNNTNLPNAAPNGTRIVQSGTGPVAFFSSSLSRLQLLLAANDTLKFAMFHDAGSAQNTGTAIASQLTVRKVG